MALSQVIKFEGSPDDIIWKYPGEEINATSQLIVDETYEALLCVNGQAADLFGPGRHTLTVPNIPIVKKIINIPTGGTNPFPCKVFYINQVHQMDMLWGTRGAIALDDPLYDIFLHVMLHGSLTFSIIDSRKFIVKQAGFRNRYTSDELMNGFKGIISSHVKDCISKIMINGQLSYFMINANLFEISEAVKERLDDIFDEYGIRIEYFNIETIEVPKEDYDAVKAAKERRSGRLIEGYTWQEERQMMIAEKFASNEGTMGNIGGAVGGFMMGGALGGSIVDIARDALNPSRVRNDSLKDLSGVGSASSAVSGGNQPGGFNVSGFLRNNRAGAAPSQSAAPAQPVAPTVPQTQMNQPQEMGKFCAQCGSQVAPGSLFCNFCGNRLQTTPVCPNCNAKLAEGSKFCNICGTKVG